MNIFIYTRTYYSYVNIYIYMKIICTAHWFLAWLAHPLHFVRPADVGTFERRLLRLHTVAVNEQWPSDGGKQLGTGYRCCMLHNGGTTIRQTLQVYKRVTLPFLPASSPGSLPLSISALKSPPCLRRLQSRRQKWAPKTSVRYVNARNNRNWRGSPMVCGAQRTFHLHNFAIILQMSFIAFWPSDM